MLYQVAQLIADSGGLPYLRTLQHVLFGFITAFGLSLLFGRRIIQFYFLKGYRDYPREDGMLSTNDKRGTPTMGGYDCHCRFISILVGDLSDKRVLIVLVRWLSFLVSVL